MQHGNRLAVGDRVRVRKGQAHDKMTAEQEGVIREISTPALGIAFEGMDGIHRWYVAEELEFLGVSTERHRMP